MTVLIPIGLRRPIGCLKLQVIFHKRATNYTALSREMTCNHKASYGFSPPCMGLFCKRDLQFIDPTNWSHPICVVRLIHMCYMANLHVCGDPFICVWWPIQMCVVTHSNVCGDHSYVWCDSSTCDIWLIRVATVVTHSYVCGDPFICVWWPIQMCVVTHSNVCGDPFICVVRLIHMCYMANSCGDMTCACLCDTPHLFVCQDSFQCVPRRIHMCAMTHYAYICAMNVTTTHCNTLQHVFLCVPWRIYMHDGTYV